MHKTLERKKPVFTSVLTLTCCALFLLLQLDTTSIGSAEAYSRLGAPYATQIYQGQFWGIGALKNRYFKNRKMLRTAYSKINGLACGKHVKSLVSSGVFNHNTGQ